MATKRALIVDDSTTAQYSLKKILQAYDLEVDSVDSGEAAMLYLAKHLPDVVFMDHLMPGMDGLRALQIIKSHPETAMVPVIMYTSKSGDVYTGQARALGALDVITKDAINSVDLSNVMRSIHIDLRSVREQTSVSAPTSVTAKEIETQSATSLKSEASVAKVAQQMVADNSRRIELRIVQLEHAIDDSRRVIAAQLIREMQKLRHNLKQELSKLLGERFGEQQQPQNVAAPLLVAHPTPPRTTSALTGFAFAILLIASFLALGYLWDLQRQMKSLNQQQNTQYEQMILVINSLLDVQAEQINQQQTAQLPLQLGNSPASVSASYFDDLVWAFNQGGNLPYSPRILAPDISVRLYEFVSRISQAGYEGLLEVDVRAGNFCVVLDSYGQAQLPAFDARLADCLLFSELLPFDTMVEQALEDINTALAGVPAVTSGKLSVLVTRTETLGTAYPSREAQITAKEWNQIAQHNHRALVVLRDRDSE